MAFVLPTFNLTCNIFTWPYNPSIPPRIADQECQLRAPNTSNFTTFTGLTAGGCGITLLLPPLVDIRDGEVAPINSRDIVECPAGSGRLYLVFYVDDIGKGFPNEHRYAMLAKSPGLPWTAPIP